ncbi:unnamed protein product [Scytosiphon promiscuus]
MDGKTEDANLLGNPARTKPAPKRATLAQLAEQRLGSLQYLLASSKTSVSATSSPPSRSATRPRASTATAARGATAAGTEAKRAAGRVRRSTSSGEVEEARTPPRDRPQGSSAAGGNSRARGNNKKGVYRLSIGNPERASVGGRNSGGINAFGDDTHRSRSSDSSSRVERKGRRQSSHSSERGIAGGREVAGRAAPRQQTSRGERELSPAAAAAAAATAATVIEEAAYQGNPAGHTFGGRVHNKLGGGSGGGGSAVGAAVDGYQDNEHEHDSCFCYSDDTDNDDDEGAYVRSRRRRRLLQNGGCLAVGVSWTAALLLFLLLCVSGGGGGAAAAAAGADGGPTAASWETAAAAGCALLGAVVLAALAYSFGLPMWRDEDESEDRQEALREEDEDGRGTICCCWRLWGRGREGMDEEGGKLAEIGGITYLAI